MGATVYRDPTILHPFSNDMEEAEAFTPSEHQPVFPISDMGHLARYYRATVRQPFHHIMPTGHPQISQLWIPQSSQKDACIVHKPKNQRAPIASFIPVKVTYGRGNQGSFQRQHVVDAYHEGRNAYSYPFPTTSVQAPGNQPSPPTIP